MAFCIIPRMRTQEARQGQYVALVPDSDVESAVWALVDAALDQPSPTAQLSESLNAVLGLIGHPARERRVTADPSCSVSALEAFRTAADDPEEAA